MAENPEGGSAAALPPERRKFLLRLSLGLTALVGAAVVTPLAGFVIWPARRDRPELWRTVGAPDDFAIGETVKVTPRDPDTVAWAGPTARTAVWLRRLGPEHFVAFSIFCTHTGCPVRWVEGAKLFLCPCHGGAFAQDGSVASGPPPRALPRHEVRVQDGQVQVRTQPIPFES